MNEVTRRTDLDVERRWQEYGVFARDRDRAGSISVINSGRAIAGGLICEGSALINSNLVITHDSDLYINPPLRYTENPLSLINMKIVRGSWRQVVN